MVLAIQCQSVEEVTGLDAHHTSRCHPSTVRTLDNIQDGGRSPLQDV